MEILDEILDKQQRYAVALKYSIFLCFIGAEIGTCILIFLFTNNLN